MQLTQQCSAALAFLTKHFLAFVGEIKQVRISSLCLSSLVFILNFANLPPSSLLETLGIGHKRIDRADRERTDSS